MLGSILGGRYQIVKHIGGGGFAQAYLAEDLHRFDRPLCVVKQLKPQATDPYTLAVARNLFDREAQVLHRLGEHPRIPRLLANFAEEQEFYLVEEFIDGHDLSHELSVGKQFTQSDTLQLLEDLLEVLLFVHQQNVIHRDLKPSNLIRRITDQKIVVIDFGAVKQMSLQTVNACGSTNLTIAIGSPGYTPSEQANGYPRFCSDIYAVGVIGIQALTGLNPLTLPKHHQTDEILWHDQAQVSAGFAAILDRMVRYDFRQRYQTAAEVLQALQSLTAPQFLTATPRHAIIQQQLSKWSHSRWFWRGAVGSGMVASLMAGYGYWQWQGDQGMQQALAKSTAAQTAGDFPTCIEQAKVIPPASPLAQAAQPLLNACYLSQAQQLAKTGKFEAAIANATKITPMSAEASAAKQFIEQWSEPLLKQSTEQYQKGLLKPAIVLAKSIPADSLMGKKAAIAIEQWQKAWQTSETQFQAATQAVSEKKWQKALEATKQVAATPFWQDKVKAIVQQAQAHLSAPSAPASAQPTTDRAPNSASGGEPPPAADSGSAPVVPRWEPAPKPVARSPVDSAPSQPPVLVVEPSVSVPEAPIVPSFVEPSPEPSMRCGGARC